MTECFVRDDNGNRVFIAGKESWDDMGNGGKVASVHLYQSSDGKKSRYPIIVMVAGDKVFVPGGSAKPNEPVYAAAANRKANDPVFNYVAYACKFKGTFGLMVRCVERKAKNKKIREEQ